MEFLKKWGIPASTMITGCNYFLNPSFFWFALGGLLVLCSLFYGGTFFLQSWKNNNTSLTTKNSETFSRNVWLSIWFVSGFICIGIGWINRPISPKNTLSDVAVTSWQKEWKCYIIQEDMTIEEAKNNPFNIHWKVEKDPQDTTGTRFELIGFNGKDKIKLSGLEQHSVESNKHACLSGRLTDEKDKVHHFEFFMSPNQTEFFGKMISVKEKNLTLWIGKSEPK